VSSGRSKWCSRWCPRGQSPSVELPHRVLALVVGDSLEQYICNAYWSNKGWIHSWWYTEEVIDVTSSTVLLSPKDLDTIKELRGLLSNFAHATTLLEADKQPTSGLVIPTIVGIKKALHKVDTQHPTSVKLDCSAPLLLALLGLCQMSISCSQPLWILAASWSGLMPHIKSATCARSYRQNVRRYRTLPYGHCRQKKRHLRIQTPARVCYFFVKCWLIVEWYVKVTNILLIQQIYMLKLNYM